MRGFESQIKGYLYAALAAAAYGTNPIFAKPLYADGMNPDSVLLFRYLLGILVMVVLMVYQKNGFRVNRHNVPQLIVMGILMALSSLLLFLSYNFMPVGIASTLLFTYPILVAVLMMLIYHERLSWLVMVCLLLATSGVALLCKSGETSTSVAESPVPLSPFAWGVVLVMLSSLSYAIYLIGLNKSRLRTIASMPVTLWVLVFGSLLFVGRLTFGDEPLTLPVNPWMWLNLLGLGILPTVVSLVMTAKAIQMIGSTQTAILGALEPVTAVVLGIIVLGETVSMREFTGMIMIFVAVTLVVLRRKK